MFLSKSVFYSFLGFLILHSPYIKSNVSFSSIRLLIDRLFKVGVPTFASNEASANILKSPENMLNITIWSSAFSKLDSTVVS